MKARVKVNSGDSYDQPLFIDIDGLAVSRRKFLSMFKETLQYLGIDSSFYSGHSFRIGAATTAGRVLIEDHLIKTLGRWSSDSYCRYIRISDGVLKKAHNTLADA